MKINKIIYESKIHISSKSHDVLILQEPKVNGVKLKMTYECYNAVERFTGELFVGGKWEHFFSILDLGVIPDKSNYVREEFIRKKRCGELQKLGSDFFDSVNQ
jgi:hypothetical protein